MKKTLSCFLIISTIIMMVGCTDYNEAVYQYDDITSISTYIKNQFDAGTLQLETIITNDNIGDFEKDEKISEIFSTDQYFYKALMSDENTIIVQKNVVFQSVTGYVATKNESLDVIEDKRYKNPVLNIPSSLGYDGNNLSIEDYLGEFEEWHLYSYIAGL